jgi:mannosyltransferase OCH1-like enzyme
MIEIPKIIHQIWVDIDEPLPKHFRLFGETWKENHPDWKYEFWDEGRMNDFIHEFYPQYLDTYNSFEYNMQRLDAIRYLILNKMGGMYVDFDTECLRSHEELLSGKTCCFSMEPESHKLHYNKQILFSNALMASIPEHPFMKKIIETVFSYIPKTEKHSAKQCIMEVLTTTGPFALVDIYEKYPEKNQVFLIPAKFVSPYNIAESNLIRKGYESKELDSRLKDVYSVHYFFGNWWGMEK